MGKNDDPKMVVTTDDVCTSFYEQTRGILGGRGITLEYLADKLKAELEANETKVFYDRSSGELVYSVPMVDWSIRQRARMDAQELLDMYPPKRQEVKHEGNIELDIHPVDLSQYRTPGSDHEGE